MFFRTKSVKGTPLVQLVESYRNAEGQPRQRVVASLGDADLPQDEKKAIARAVEDHLCGQSDLLPAADQLSEEGARWVAHITKLVGRSRSARPTRSDKVDGVLVDGIATENVVQFGPQLVARAAWRELGLDNILADAGLHSAQIATAHLLVANRLIEPLSEWALIDWSAHTALPELLDIRVTKTTKDRLYYTGDALFAKRKFIESALREAQAGLFGSCGGIVLYDVTNTHFEGLCAKNPKARHGKNKQKRNDCRQVAIGMAFDERGLPLAHEVFEGNIADTKTLIHILERLQLGSGEQSDAGDDPGDGEKPLVILDAGFASQANLALLRERGFGYLINITRSSRTGFAEEFAAAGFEPVPDRERCAPVEVRTIPDPENEGGVLVLCRSAARREKELAMISKAEKRFLDDAAALRERIAKGRLKDAAKIERAIGRLQKKHPRVARFFKLRHEAGGLTITRDDGKLEEAGELCGNYVLRTDRSLGAARTWSLYMTLLQAEEGYACLKGSLGLRPNFHQLEERVEAHIFLSVLAYHLLCWVREKLRDSGDVRDWKTIRRLLSTHSLATTRLPLEDGRVLHIRKATIPDAEQARVYRALGIDWKKEFPVQKRFVKS
ncbi:MAG: IS1634 family transposase [Verrucomicrobiales bacterium]